MLREKLVTQKLCCIRVISEQWENTRKDILKSDNSFYEEKTFKKIGKNIYSYLQKRYEKDVSKFSLRFHA